MGFYGDIVIQASMLPPSPLFQGFKETGIKPECRLFLHYCFHVAQMLSFVVQRYNKRGIARSFFDGRSRFCDVGIMDKMGIMSDCP